MLGELGLISLILATILALVLTLLPVWGYWRKQPGLVAMAPGLSMMVFSFTGLSLLILILAFLVDDFSLKYVASHSSLYQPWYFKFSAVWGAHEGSLLLWAWMLTGWAMMVALKPKGLTQDEHSLTLSLLGFIILGFLLFILFTSNPFERLPSVPEDGLGLNPLLQDIALILHPPLLYMGYVGLAVSFSLAVAQLWLGEARPESFAWSRQWTLVSWAFLTLGIALGSWWAYYELGWGGWWFWDPVENASLLPWLVATALIHSLLVSEKRGLLIGWTLLLAILAFGMSLIGAFLVRSGVLTSVHAFATDPTRGTYILIFLVLVIGSALVLFSLRAHKMAKVQPIQIQSKETALLFNNVLLMVMTASVLLGTLYPLLLDALGLGKLSVGPPYFNAVIIPLTIPLALLMGLGFYLRWKQDSVARLARELWWLGLFTALALMLAALWLMPDVQGMALVGLGLAAWVGLSALAWLLRHRWLTGQLPKPMLGAALAHIGFALMLVGIALSSLYGIERDIRMAPGETVELNDYKIQFISVEQGAGPNYLMTQAKLTLFKADQWLTDLEPEKRIYIGHSMPMSEVALDAGLSRDVYVALGEPIGDQGAWSFRIQYKPFIRAIWLGALLMAAGAFIAVWGRRSARNSHETN